MDRRRAVALILGLVLCLALLGVWVVRFDNNAPLAESPTATPPSPPRGPVAEIVQVPRDDLRDPSTVSYEAPIGPGVFRGRVIDAVSREPIREFTVELHPSRPTSPEPPPRLSRSFRNKEGRFEYIGLPTGTWTILTTASGYQRFDMPAVRLSEREQPEDVLIPMRAGLSVHGRVVDEITNAGIASATVSFREASVGRYEGNFRLRPSVQSRKDGSFTLDGLPPGVVRLQAYASNYVVEEIETFVSRKTAPVELALSKGATLSGYLAGTDGITPVQGEVNLTNVDENHATQISTGAAGEFSFSRLSAGRYLLTGRGGGLNGKREITLSRNERIEGLVLPMTAGHSIRGVISGLRPDERAAAMILVNSLGTAGSMTYQGNANERGAYEVTGVAPGRAAIEVVARGRGLLTKMVEMPATSDLTVNLEFKTGARLTGRVTRGGKPLPGTTLNAGSSTDSDTHFTLAAVTAANGEYAIEDVPDGNYMLTVDSYNSPIVRVMGDTVFDMDVPETQLSGRVLEEGGKVPVVGASIDVRPAQPASNSNSMSDRSDHFGQFGIRGLQPGDFVLSAYKPGYELYRAPLSYGSPVADLAIYLRRARGVEIKVREADSNEPIDNVHVVELAAGMPGIVTTLHTDPNGIGYLPSGLAGSSLRISAMGYQVLEVIDWNGEPLDASLQRESVP